MAVSPDEMVPSGPSSAGQQAVIAYLQSKGLPINAGNIRRAVEANARDPGSMEANGPNLGPTVLNLRNAGIEDASPMSQSGGGGGRTSAQPTSAPPAQAITPNVRPDIVAPQGGGGAPPAVDPASGGGLMQVLAPLLAGGAAGSFPLGAYILDKIRGGGAPVGRSPAAISAGPRLSTTGPGFNPEYGPAGTRPSGPGFDPEYGPARPAAPPTQPVPGPRVPVEPIVPPAAPTAPTGAGFSPEYGSPAAAPVPPSPASTAIDEAIKPPPVQQAPKAKIARRVRVPIRPMIR